MNNQNNISTQDTFDIKYILLQIASRWHLILLSILLFLALAVWKNKKAIPQYHVSSKILIEVPRDRVVYDDGATSGIDLLDRAKSVNNEIQVLHSRDLVQRAMDSLEFNARYFYSDFGATEIFGEQVPFIVNADFSSAGQLQGAKFEVEMLQDDTYSLSVGAKNLGTFSLGQEVNYRGFEFTIDCNTDSQIDLASMEPVLFYLDTDEALIDKYMGSLEILVSDKDTDAIRLALNDNVPERGVQFMNTLLECYFMKLLEDRKYAAETTYHFIDERLNLNFGHLDSLEYAIENYKRSNNIVDPDLESRYILQGIKQFEIELSDAETQLEIVSDLVDKALTSPRQELDLSVPNTMLGVTDPLLNNLLKELNTKQNRLRTMTKTVHPDNPVYQELQAEIADLRSSVMVDLFNLKENMHTSVRHIKERIRKYKYQLNGMSYGEKGLAAMERLRSNKEELYIYLLKKREEAAMVLASELLDTWVIEKPFASGAFYNPKRGVVILVGIFLGLFVPVSLILLWMLIDSRVRRPEDIRLGGITPSVGAIRFAASNDSAAAVPVHSFLREDLKQLAFNLRFQYPGIKRLMIGSSSSDEGKSLSACQLAISEASLGKKVCVVELNMRKPALGTMMSLSVGPGLVEYLLGESKLAASISKSAEAPNVDFICSGQCPVDPTRLLIDGKLDELFDLLDERYDLVIFDTPGLTEVSDALHVSRLADATLIVVRQGVTKKEGMKSLGAMIGSKQLINTAMVFNGRDDKQSELGSSMFQIRSSLDYVLHILSSLTRAKSAAWKA